MSYLTDRKRAVGMGASRTGTQDHWRMTISSYALIVLVPLFLFTFGTALGKPHEEVLAHFARPFPAIVTGLMLVVGLWHFRTGFQSVIDDYVGGMARKLCIVALALVSYGLMAAGLFALVRLAL